MAVPIFGGILARIGASAARVGQGSVGEFLKDSAKLQAGSFLMNNFGMAGQAATMKIMGHTWGEIGKTMAMGAVYRAFAGTGPLGTLVSMGALAALTRQNLKTAESTLPTPAITKTDPRDTNPFALIQKIDKKNVEAFAHVKKSIQNSNTLMFKRTELALDGLKNAQLEFKKHRAEFEKLEKHHNDLGKRVDLLQQKLNRAASTPGIGHNSRQAGLSGAAKAASAVVGKADEGADLAAHVNKISQSGGLGATILQGALSKLIFSAPIPTLLASFGGGVIGGTIGGFLAGLLKGGSGTGLPKGKVMWTPEHFTLMPTGPINIMSPGNINIQAKNTLTLKAHTLVIDAKVIKGLDGFGGGGSGKSGMPNPVDTGMDMIGEPDKRSRFQALKDRHFGRDSGGGVGGAGPRGGGRQRGPSGQEGTGPGGNWTPYDDFTAPRQGGTTYGPGAGPAQGMQQKSPRTDYGPGTSIPNMMGRPGLLQGTEGKGKGGIIGNEDSLEGGKLTPGSTGIRSDLAVERGVPASIRYNNPGAQYPSKRAELYGQMSYGVIGGGHKIAQFPTRTHGLAANMDNFRSYEGLTLEQAKSKWRDDPRNGKSPMPAGFDPNQKMTKELMNDPKFMIPWMKAMGKHEAGKTNPITDAEYEQAHKWFSQGGIGEPTSKKETFNPKMSIPGIALDNSQSRPGTMLQEGSQPSQGPWRNFHDGVGPDPRDPLSMMNRPAIMGPAFSDSGPMTGDKFGALQNEPKRYGSDTLRRGQDDFNWSLSRAGQNEFGPAGGSVPLTTLTTKGNLNYQVHRDRAKQTNAFVDDLENRGYKIGSIGGYANRNKVGGGGGLSTHATGTTIDLNPAANWINSGKTDMPANMEKLGWLYRKSWGGRFGDAMHFEVMSKELHQKRLEQLVKEGFITKEIAEYSLKHGMPPPNYREQIGPKLDQDLKKPAPPSMEERYEKETGNKPHLVGMTPGNMQETKEFKAWKDKQTPAGISTNNDELRAGKAPGDFGKQYDMNERYDSPSDRLPPMISGEGQRGDRRIEQYRDIWNRGRSPTQEETGYGTEFSNGFASGDQVRKISTNKGRDAGVFNGPDGKSGGMGIRSIEDQRNILGKAYNDSKKHNEMFDETGLRKLDLPRFDKNAGDSWNTQVHPNKRHTMDGLPIHHRITGKDGKEFFREYKVKGAYVREEDRMRAIQRIREQFPDIPIEGVPFAPKKSPDESIPMSELKGRVPSPDALKEERSATADENINEKQLADMQKKIDNLEAKGNNAPDETPQNKMPPTEHHPERRQQSDNGSPEGIKNTGDGGEMTGS